MRRRYNSTTRTSESRLHELLEKVKKGLYAKDYYRFSPKEMRELLHELGATDADIEDLKELFDSDVKRLDPGNRRKYVNTRFWHFRKESDDEPLCDVWKTRKHAPHEAAVIDDQTFRDGNDGLPYRPYAATDDRMTVNRAMEAFMMILVDAARPKMNPDRPGEVVQPDGSRSPELLVLQTTQQVCFEPDGLQSSTASPEGIHQDGGDVVLVVMMERYNVLSGAESRLYDLEVPLGYHQDSEDALRLEHLLHPQEETRFTMAESLEAIMIVDQNLKHEARGELIPVNQDERAYRNALTLHLRRPNNDGSDTVKMERAKLMPPTNDTNVKLKWLQDEFADETEAFAIAERMYHAHRALVAKNMGDRQQRIKDITAAFEAMAATSTGENREVSLAACAKLATKLEAEATPEPRMWKLRMHVAIAHGAVVL